MEYAPAEIFIPFIVAALGFIYIVYYAIYTKDDLEKQVVTFRIWAIGLSLFSLIIYLGWVKSVSDFNRLYEIAVKLSQLS